MNEAVEVFNELTETLSVQDIARMAGLSCSTVRRLAYGHMTERTRQKLGVVFALVDDEGDMWQETEHGLKYRMVA